jgi:crotonobetainyl-CoA:carnitine CoA-transferase CaiB-like acyl-CoA transferase
MLLADWGAEVIKVESRYHFPVYTRGVLVHTPTQLATTFSASGGYAAYAMDGYDPATSFNRNALFCAQNRNKLSITLDLRRPEGKDIFRRLIQVSDMFIESNAAAIKERLGITWDVVKEWNPKLIMLSLPGFGSTGPYKYYRALGAHQEGFGGHTYIRGYRDEDLDTNVTIYHTDEGGGATAAFAALMALYQRQKTGKGQWIDMSQAEGTMPHLAQAIMDYTMNGRVTERMGNRDFHGAIQGCYRCWGRDDWVVLTIGTDEEWQGFCRALGDPEWTKDEKFSDPVSRLKNHDELDRLIGEWTRQHDKYEVMHLLQAEGVPAGPVMDERDAYTDPHIRERGFFEPLTHAEIGTHLYPGIAWRMSKTPNHLRTATCRFGEHNEYVYKELLKVSDEEYELLVKEGHIGTDYDPAAGF